MSISPASLLSPKEIDETIIQFLKDNPASTVYALLQRFMRLQSILDGQQERLKGL
jgi:hypothetical protein